MATKQPAESGTHDITEYHSCSYNLKWRGCYSKDSLYTKYVTPESFRHPAKCSWGLLERIFKHLKELRLIADGTTIIDFMAGSGRTLTIAELHGYPAVGLELEPHFISMIEGNKAQMEKITGRKAQMQFIQGDARQLSGMLKEKGYCGVVSPPYSNAISKQGGEIRDDLKNYIGVSCAEVRRYSMNPDNIGNLKDAPLIGITSPPYGELLNEKKNTTSNLSREERLKTAGHIPKDFMGGTARNCSLEDGLRYSHNPENIGNLKDRQLVGITSPPYESADNMFHDIKWVNKNRPRPSNRSIISEVEDNIERERGETYLQAMLMVYSEAFCSGISPLVIVVKNPTRNGKLRRLDLDTIALLQKSGYEIFDYHRAILFDEITQGTLDGENFTKPKGRLSFFKRLSYLAGNVVAKHEDVIFARIPNGRSNMTGITSPPYSEAQTGGGIAVEGYRGKHINEMGKNQPDKVGDRCGYMKARHGTNSANIGNLSDKETEP